MNGNPLNSIHIEFSQVLATKEMRNLITEHKIREIIRLEAGVARDVEFDCVSRLQNIKQT